MPAKKAILDTLIVGAGPIGLACGIEAKRQKLTHLIIEKGCLVNSIYHYPANMTFFSTSERIEIGNIPFVSHGDKPTRREALEYYRRVKQHFNLPVNTYEKVLDLQNTKEVLGSQKNIYRVVSNKGEYLTRSLVIASGFFDLPNKLQIPGEELPKVKHYFDEAHPYAEHKVMVIGGGNSAVDAALETYRVGAEVSMIVRKATLKPSIKYWVLPDIENRIKEGAIKAFFNSHIVEIRADKVIVQSPEGIEEIPNDFVLAMTGFQPDFAWLKHMGINSIKNEKGVLIPEHHPTSFETNRPNVYLAGVVCGGMNTSRWFIENARFHAEIIMRKIKSLRQ